MTPVGPAGPPGPRPARGRPDPLGVLAALAVVVTVATVVVQAATASTIRLAGGCGWDGAAYCAMAAGREAPAPFSRRPLVPWLVRLEHVGPLLDRFLAVDVVLLTLALGCVVGIVRHLTQGLGARRRNAAAAVAAALTVLAPFTVHFTLTYRANSDAGALALGLLWLLLVLRRSNWAVPAAAAVCLAREEWAVIVVVVCLVDLVGWRARWRSDLACAVTAGAAVALDFALPHTGPPYPGLLGVVRTSLRHHLVTAGGPERLVWMLVVGLGLVPLLLVLPEVRALERRALWLSATGSAVAVVLAVVGGTDTSRIVLPAAVVLSTLAVAAVARSERTAVVVALGIAFLGSAILWRPWEVVPGSAAGWLSAFEPYDLPDATFWPRLVADARVAVATVVAMTVVLGISTLAGRRARRAAGAPA